MHKLLFLFGFDIQNNFGIQHVLQMLQASEKDLPVLSTIFTDTICCILKKELMKRTTSKIDSSFELLDLLRRFATILKGVFLMKVPFLIDLDFKCRFHPTFFR